MGVHKIMRRNRVRMAMLASTLVSGAAKPQATISSVGSRLGEICSISEIRPLPPEYRAALERIEPKTAIKTIVAYPAIRATHEVLTLADVTSFPRPLDSDSRKGSNTNWFIQQQLVRSPFFAAELFSALTKTMGDESVFLSPIYPDSNGGFDYRDVSMSYLSAMEVDTRVYSYTPSLTLALKYWKKEAVTAGPLVTPVIGVTLRNGQGFNSHRPITVSPLRTEYYQQAASGQKSTRSAKQDLRAFAIKRVDLGDQWIQYVARPSGKVSPFHKMWADKTARDLARVYKDNSTPQTVGKAAELYGRALFGSCSASVATRFSPAQWAEVIRLGMKSESDLMRQQSSANYRSLTTGAYGRMIRTQMAEEALNITRWRRAERAQGRSALFAALTAAAVGYTQGGQIARPSYAGSLVDLQSNFSAFTSSYMAGRRAQDARQTNASRALEVLSATTADAQIEGLAISGRTNATALATSLSQLRASTANLILDTAGYKK